MVNAELSAVLILPHHRVRRASLWGMKKGRSAQVAGFTALKMEGGETSCP